MHAFFSFLTNTIPRRYAEKDALNSSERRFREVTKKKQWKNYPIKRFTSAYLIPANIGDPVNIGENTVSMAFQSVIMETSSCKAIILIQ